MDFLHFAAILMLLAFVIIDIACIVLLLSFVSWGIKARKWREASADTSSPAAAQSVAEPTEQQLKEREQLIAEQHAFSAMLGYNADIAYGLGGTQLKDKE